MSWDGKQFSRPLVMLRREKLESLYKTYGYAPDDEVRELYPMEEIGADLGLSILLMQGRTEDAVNLLASAITPRVGVWWAYLSLQMVFEDVRKDFEKDGLTPKERRKKEVEAKVKELTDTSDIEKMIEEHKKATDELVKKIEADAQGKVTLPPLERAKLKLQWIKREYAQYMKQESPDWKPETPSQPLPEDSWMRQKQIAIEQEWKEKIEALKAENDETLPPGVPDARKIFDAIKQKTAAIKPAIDKEMSKHFPLKLKGLPKPVSPARKTAAVEAALRWLLVPSDSNGKLACEAAVAAQAGPESMLAFTAFWASTNLVTETGVAPTNLALPPMGISKTLLQLALMEGGEMDYDARYAEFLRLGIECADGTCTWDEHGKPLRHDPGAAPEAAQDDRIFRTRYGFGRGDMSI